MTTTTTTAIMMKPDPLLHPPPSTHCCAGQEPPWEEMQVGEGEFSQGAPVLQRARMQERVQAGPTAAMLTGPREGVPYQASPELQRHTGGKVSDQLYHSARERVQDCGRPKVRDNLRSAVRAAL